MCILHVIGENNYKKKKKIIEIKTVFLCYSFFLPEFAIKLVLQIQWTSYITFLDTR